MHAIIFSNGRFHNAFLFFVLEAFLFVCFCGICLTTVMNIVKLTLKS